MKTRLLQRDDFEDLHKAFCLAFSDNMVPLKPNPNEFDYRIHTKLNIDYDLSGASFDGEEMIAFILHTSNIYQGIPTAFNAGTGVIPGFRNQRTGEELYEFLLPKIISQSNARILLEVIEKNVKAIKLYEKLGFQYRRKFLCFKAENGIQSKSSHNIRLGTMEDIWEEFQDFEPSFADSLNQLVLSQEKVLVGEQDGKVAGYLVYQPQIGRISQVAVSRVHRNMGIATSLISKAAEESPEKVDHNEHSRRGI